MTPTETSRRLEPARREALALAEIDRRAQQSLEASRRRRDAADEERQAREDRVDHHLALLGLGLGAIGIATGALIFAGA